MEISLIISGNLTGFSRFYASPNANDVYNEAKFDFDYRNFLTFLNAGEKAYAISFSPKIIAVSLITRILDSFRRPGILVVTALIPRYQLVRGQLNQSDKTAIFNLLNEVNDKFYQKNFLNGMVNQNPAVLMQDYYSDILSRYVFVNDRMQKPINSRIDVTSPNKRIGYVAAVESSMPQYLSSVMRKSYEGYHHVFLSPHAPQNIDEPAEEILTYKVRIENGNRPVPGEVRLTDRIPNINPEQGEKDIPNKSFTYGQVISGEAGADFIGTIENGETIVLSYRFPKEEKTVYFRFYDGANEVPIHIIRPEIVESNGSRYPLSTNSWSFRGKEIYGHKNLKSGNSEYTIDNPALDISRMRNDETINIYVHRGWSLEYNFGNFNKPKTIILTNVFSHERRVSDNVTDIFVEHGLSGNRSDWNVEIQSDYYETVRIPASKVKFNIYPKVEKPINTIRQKDGGQNIPSRQGGQHTTFSNSDQGLKIANGDQHTAKPTEVVRKEKQKKILTIGAIALLSCLIVGIFLTWDPFEWFKEKPIVENSDTKDVVDLVNEVYSFALVDGSDNSLIKNNQVLYQLDLIIASDSASINETIDGPFKREIEYDSNKPETPISVRVFLKEASNKDGVVIVPKNTVELYNETFSISELSKNDINRISLPIRNSELVSYVELLTGQKPTGDVNKQIKSLRKDDRKQSEFSNLLEMLLPSKNEDPVIESDGVKPSSTKNQIKDEISETNSNTDSDIPEELDGLWLSMKDLNGMTGEKYKGKASQKRISALKTILSKIEKGDKPNTPKKGVLHERQEAVVNGIISLANDIDNLPSESQSQKDRKSKLKEEFNKTLKLPDSNGKISLNTASGVLKMQGKVNSAKKAK